MSFLWHSAQRRLNCQLLAVIWWERFCHIYQLCAHSRGPLCPKWPSSCDSHLLFLRADKKPPLGKGSRSSGQGWCSKSLKWFFQTTFKSFETMGKADAQILQTDFSNHFQDFLKLWAKLLKVFWDFFKKLLQEDILKPWFQQSCFKDAEIYTKLGKAGLSRKAQRKYLTFE